MVPVALQDTKVTRPPTMRTLLRFLWWMIQTDPHYSIALLALQFASGLLPAASVWVVRALFDRSLAVYEGHLPVADMLVWIALWAVLALAQVVFRMELFSLLVERLKQEMEDQLLAQLQRKANVLRLETFERADFHDVLRRAQEAATPGFFFSLIGEIHMIITGTLTVVSVALVVGLWNPLLLIAIALVAVPPPLAQMLQGKNTFLLKREQTQRERLRAYLERILTERAAAKEVRVFNLGSALLGWWEHLYWQVADRLFQQRRSQSLVNVLLAAFSLAGLAAGIGWSAWAVANGGLSPGQFAAMMVALQQVCTHVDSVFFRFGYLANRLLYIADLFTYLDLGPEESKEGQANRQRRRGPDCSQRSLLPLSSGGMPGNRRHLIHHPARRARSPRRCQRLGQDHAGQGVVGLVPSHRGKGALRRCRSEPGGSERPVGPIGRRVPRLHPFRLFSGRKYRLGTHRTDGRSSSR